MVPRPKTKRRRASRTPRLERPRPTRLHPATAALPDDVFVEARGEQRFAGLAGRAIEELPRSRRGPAQRLDLELAGYRPDWADLQRIPPLEVVTSRHRISGRARAKGLTTVTWAQETPLRFTFPWSVIGKVRSGNMPNFNAATRNGTGVLVGPNLLLTASHLAPWDHPAAGWWMSFTPAFNAQHPTLPAPFGMSFVERYRGIKYLLDADPDGTDYVICKLYEPLGKRLGWMGTRSYGDEDKYFDQPFISVGYPSDFDDRPMVDFDIYVKDIDSAAPGREIETLYAKAFGGGWSGGPLWSSRVDGSDARVYGIKSGHEIDEYDPIRGVFAGGGHMVELTRHGLTNWG